MGKKSRERRDKFQQLQRQKQAADLKQKSLLADYLKRHIFLAASDLLPPESKYPQPRDNPIMDCCPILSEIILVSTDSFSRLYNDRYGHLHPVRVPSFGDGYKKLLIDLNLPCLPMFNDCFVEFDDTDNYPVAKYRGERVTTGVKIDVVDISGDYKNGSWDVPQHILNDLKPPNDAHWGAAIRGCTFFHNGSYTVFPVIVVYFDNEGYIKDIVSADFKEPPPDEITASVRAACIALFTFSLLHCRNIETVDHEPDPAISHQYQQHFGQPLTTYKTLRIKPMGKQYGSSEPKDYQGLMPLHLRRGNFAHYTEDAPLFGKYTGTFWRPATAVGEAKNGTVVKDYKVIAE